MSGMPEIKMGKACLFLTLEQKEYDLVLMLFDIRLGSSGQLPPQILVSAPAPYASLVTEGAWTAAPRFSLCGNCT